MFKTHFKAILIIFLTIIFLIGSIPIAFSASSQESNYKLKKINIYFNGKKFNQQIDAIVQVKQGTMFIPIRKLSEILGVSADWQGKNSSLYLTEIKTSNLDSKKVSTPLEQITVLRNVGPFYQQKTRKIKISGREFARGIEADLAKGSKEVVLELKGKYNLLNGYVGIDDETRNSKGGFTITFYGDESEIYKSQTIKPSFYPFYININVAKVQRLRIKIDWHDCEVGDYDKIIVALANFSFHQ
ncbi:NPCBM/NEW2 domain-containing protein [Bacillota bacterium LX-D]|nr:NPCBM/NEW2 domain-containing protein [Bacillota bacterium LX-D]